MKQLLFLSIIAIFFACNPTTSTIKDVPLHDYTTDLATNVHFATYQDLASASDSLLLHINQLSNSPSQNELEICREYWRMARHAWEQSEGFLFGPVSTENIDPQIDSWPIDFHAIEIELAGTSDFTQSSTMAQLDEGLKGFHPIEYLLWGDSGQKTVDEFTNREFNYLKGLAIDLRDKSIFIKDSWLLSPMTYGSYFCSPSMNNPYYSNYFSVLLEQVNALIGICDELSASKIGVPLLFQDPSLEESPYSQSSIQDFKDNVKSVEAVYSGDYHNKGLGIRDLVRTHSLALDQEIMMSLATVQFRLDAIHVPFGQAIIEQSTEMLIAKKAIESLSNTLSEKLLPFIIQHYAHV
jgi:uncharacterized iron-regulated protein